MAQRFGCEQEAVSFCLRVRRLGFRGVLTRVYRGARNPLKGVHEGAFDHYDMTVAMLNKTMGLCLR